MRLFPHRLKGEGHFLALLGKKQTKGELGGWGEAEASQKAADKTGLPPAIGKEEELREFLSETGMCLDLSRIVIHQNHVYYLPLGLRWNLPLRFLRTGLLLGELKKGRFEPSQAFAMALRADQYTNVLRLDAEDPRVIRYLKGETLSLGDGEAPYKGWCLVAVEDFPLGWAKGGGATLKNKYYPGWRWR